MNKVTKEFLESEIVDVTYTRLAGTLTHCAITVKSGFIRPCRKTLPFTAEI